jgi:hypothetical protein
MSTHGLTIKQDPMEGAVMKIQKLFVVAIVMSLILPTISAEETVDIGDPGLLAEAAVNQDPDSPSDEAVKLFKNEPAGMKINGWMAVGNGGLADATIQTGALDPGNIGINQLGISMDKAGEKYRLHIDLLYGRDANLFRSTQNSGNGWDNSDGFVHDDHAWALPQAFVEGAVGDWTAKGGHFLFASHTGQYSTDRFFATRTATENTTRPYTLTGVTLTGKVGDVDTTLGWAAGVNTGFDTDSSNSSVFVIGASRGLGDKMTVSYDALIGDHQAGSVPGLPVDYYHEATVSYAASDKLTVDLTHVNFGGPIGTARVIRQSAYYSLSDTMMLGQRYEYFKNSVTFIVESASVGINYRNPSWSNVLLRPEIRWENVDGARRTDFFMDVVVTF